jgi:hypothetical protein
MCVGVSMLRGGIHHHHNRLAKYETARFVSQRDLLRGAPEQGTA